jgi:integrase
MDRTRPLASLAEVEAVEAAIDNTRDHCLFLVGIQTGLRGSDLVAIRVGDARRAVSTGGSLNDPQAWQRRTHPRSGDLPMQLRLSMCLTQGGLKALAQSVDERVTAADDDPLFVTAAGDALSQKALTRLWQQWVAKAGLNGRFTAHSSRLTFVLRTSQERLPVRFSHPPVYDFR